MYKDSEVDDFFEMMLKKCHRCQSEEQQAIIRNAFLWAKEIHTGKRRKSGELFIFHPLEVALIVGKKIGLGYKAIVTALLHDILDDSDFTIDDISIFFGEKIAYLVDGVHKISHSIQFHHSQQAEILKQIIIGLSDDIHVIYIKLAERLHDMRTLDFLPVNRQLKLAGETLHIYAPLAQRVGSYDIKVELEDLALKYRQPNVYKEIVEKINFTNEKRVSFINRFSLPIIEKLTKNKIKYRIDSRPKSISSIWNKMQNKKVPFEEVFDLFAIRIIFTPSSLEKEIEECWKIFSHVIQIYPTTSSDRLRDWITSPKSNGYEALHITVMSKEERWVEVQIRSERMNEIAERGLAAHWKYKGLEMKKNQLDRWAKEIKWQLQTCQSDDLEFLENYKLTELSSEIFVLSNVGEIYKLPNSATVLDFAFSSQNENAFNCIGAKVNARVVELQTILHSGDEIEILTSKTQHPQTEWLKFVITPKAKTLLREYFRDIF